LANGCLANVRSFSRFVFLHQLRTNAGSCFRNCPNTRA
jgi:hypothetical protein